MPTFTLYTPQKGRIVLLCQLSLPCGVLCFFALLQSVRLACFAAGIFAFCLWLLGRRARTYRLCVFPKTAAHPQGLFVLTRGRFWQRTDYIPCDAIYSYAYYASPLLRLAGCSVLVCATAGRNVFFPPFADKDLALLPPLGKETP